MSYLKNSITLFVIFLLSTPTNSHGPSRQKVSESIEINASSDEVWKIVSDFNNFNWNKSVEKISASSNDVGAERTIFFKSGESIKQKLEKIDESKMMVNWRIIETDNKVLPVNSYSAKIFVKPNDTKTKVIYKSGFYRGFMGNDPPAELNDENSKKKVKIFIVENLNGLKKIIEKN